MNAQSGRQRALGCRQTKEIFDRTSLYQWLDQWQYLLGPRAESDAAERDEGGRTCHHIATPTEHLTLSSANP